MLTEKDIKEKLQTIDFPMLSPPFCLEKSLKDICIDAKKNNLRLTFSFGFPVHESLQKELMPKISFAFKDYLEKYTLDVQCHWKIATHAVPTSLKPHPQIKNVIAIASGKGGVGKSTTTVNLALALAQTGAQVGILDADIYGPNQPHMLGISEGPPPRPDKKFEPVIAHGVQSISIGYLIDTNTPMVWRGPMVSGALQQLWRDTLWKNLDYLFIDLPPGTGDIQLTLAQKIPVTGAVIITTPQDIALLDARKGLEMFRKVNVPILGVIENMSTHICEHCGHEQAIFGDKGAEQLADRCDVSLLGKLPLKLTIRQAVDQGNPTVVADPHGDIATRYRNIALSIAAKISNLAIDYSAKFPKVVVE